MKSVLFIFFVVILLLSCSTSKKTSSTGESIKSTDMSDSKKETPGDWQVLFDGQTMKGWHKYGGEPAGSAWKIADHALYLDTSNKVNGKVVGGGDIVTDEEFENFHLKLKWKISRNGNSGIMFYV